MKNRQVRPGLLVSLAVAVAVTIVAPAATATAADEGSSAPDTLRLAILQEEAVRLDPRGVRGPLETEATGYRLSRLRNRRLPQISLLGEATTQSEVVTIPVNIPGVEVAQPPEDQYALTLRADWLLYDGGESSSEADVERAGLAVAEAQLQNELFGVRWEVAGAFFKALALQEHAREMDVLIADLGARLAEMRVRVAAGAALDVDAALLEAETLGLEQQLDALLADRRAAFVVLRRLTGQEFADDAVLALPMIDDQVDSLPSSFPPGAAPNGADLPDNLRSHPQFAVFAARHAQIDRRIAVAETRKRPRASAFGNLSYGRPGYQQFAEDFHDYWRVGIRLDWSPWDWRDRSFEVATLQVQQRIITTEEEAFAERLLREVQYPLQTIEQVRTALATDTKIIELREKVAERAETRFAERAIPASDYVDARTDLLIARVNHALHRAQLAQAQAEYLMTLGMEIE